VETSGESEIPAETWSNLEELFGVTISSGAREDVQEAFDIWAAGRKPQPDTQQDLRRIADGEAELGDFESRSVVVRDLRAEMALRPAREQPAAKSRLDRYREKETFLAKKFGRGRLQYLDRDRAILRIAAMLKLAGVEPTAYRSNNADGVVLGGSVIEALDIIMRKPPCFLMLDDELQPIARRAQRMGEEGQFRGLSERLDVRLGIANQSNTHPSSADLVSEPNLPRPD
jgi:hypothetical protein